MSGSTVAKHRRRDDLVAGQALCVKGCSRSTDLRSSNEISSPILGRNKSMDSASMVESYLESLPESVFPQQYANVASVLLAGSVGWGIKDSLTPGADWDLHILLPDDEYRRFVEAFGSDYLIDDKRHNPTVFAQFHGLSWLEERVSSNDRAFWPLYAWILSMGKWVRLTEPVSKLVSRSSQRFEADLESLVQAHFVTFAVRKLDVKSAASNGQDLSEALYLGECITAALRTYSLGFGKPYPYNKWLPKWVSEFSAGTEFVGRCEAVYAEHTHVGRVSVLRELERDLISVVRSRFGDKKWLDEWWLFLPN